jgi:tripartite-type tricarboxylate transporter receptor subunit TctC
MLHVPYKGTAPALTGLMGSDIQILVDVPSTLMPHVRGGKIKALAMFSAKRVPGAQEVPTMAEAGGPAIESSTWLLFLAPAGTPARDRQPALAGNRQGARVGRDPLALRHAWDLPGGGTPEQAAKFLDDEIGRWAKVIKTAGVKADD